MLPMKKSNRTCVRELPTRSIGCSSWKKSYGLLARQKILPANVMFSAAPSHHHQSSGTQRYLSCRLGRLERLEHGI